MREDTKLQKNRSSHPEMFLRVLKICSKFTGEYPCRRVISHFGMGVLLQICCIFSEHFFLETPLDGCFWRIQIFWSICCRSQYFVFSITYFILQKLKQNSKILTRVCWSLLRSYQIFSENEHLSREKWWLW